MIICAVSVAEVSWRCWLDAVSNMRVVRDVELPVATLAEPPGALALAEHYGLSVPHARDLLPADTARYVSETPSLGRDGLLQCLDRSLDDCRAAGVRSASLEMGLDRIGDDTFEEDFAERAKLLRCLMPLADERRLTVCVQVRQPRAFPRSKEWEHAANLVHDLMHPCCRLALNVVPAECGPGFDVQEFVRSCYFHIGVVRFHYDPQLGENLGDDAQREWAAALRSHGFRGAVVFCPKLTDDDAIPRACERIDAWAELYGAAAV